jgi:uncharacterized membrane protein YgdD (TMEM256/DUF423 family)
MVAMRNPWLIVAGISGAVAVAMGAYGAHGLGDALLALEFTEDQIRTRISDRYQPAVLYHLVHSAALAVVAALSASRPGVLVAIAGTAFVVGILLFSGLLYVLTFADYSGLGAVVPLGGVAYIAGWLALALSGGLRGDGPGG